MGNSPERDRPPSAERQVADRVSLRAVGGTAVRTLERANISIAEPDTHFYAQRHTARPEALDEDDRTKLTEALERARLMVSDHEIVRKPTNKLLAGSRDAVRLAREPAGAGLGVLKVTEFQFKRDSEEAWYVVNFSSASDVSSSLEVAMSADSGIFYHEVSGIVPISPTANPYDRILNLLPQN